MNQQPKDARVGLILPAEIIVEIDDWRRSQADIPNRSEAIRRLIARALERTP